MNSPDTDLSQEELVRALNELLEAERAGARVARETAVQLQTNASLQVLVQDIQHDEVRWCGMLLQVLKSLQAKPSDQTGAFHGKAMAIDDIEQRLAFLNRGQAWVVRRLQALIPRVSDAGIQAELQSMLHAHVGNIDRVERTLNQAPN